MQMLQHLLYLPKMLNYKISQNPLVYCNGRIFVPPGARAKCFGLFWLALNLHFQTPHNSATGFGMFPRSKICIILWYLQIV